MTKNTSYKSFLKENRSKEQAIEIYEQRVGDSSKVFKKFSNSFFYRNCPVCGENEADAEEKFNNEYVVVRCDRCASLYVNPTPCKEALDYYYNHCECNKRYGELLKSRVNQKSIILSERTRFVLTIVERLLEQKSLIRVLEVGSNSGAFLYELKQALIGAEITNQVYVVGIDIDKTAVNNPVSDDIELHHSSAEDFVEKTSERFDLILHFELIEHLNDPFGFCASLKHLLKKNGLMYFHTPNGLGLDNQALSYNDFRPLAHSIFPPMHLNAFTTQNVVHFLLRAGFSVLNIETPGNFDVDIVRQFVEKNSPYAFIRDIEDENFLGVLQHTLRLLNGSSHMAVLAKR